MKGLFKWFNWILVLAGAILLVLLLASKSETPFWGYYSAKLWLVIILTSALYGYFLFCRRSYSERLVQWEKKFVTIFAMAALILVVTEAVLRIFDLPRDKIRELLPNLNVVFRPDPKLLPGVKETARLTTDNMGFRVTHPIDYSNHPPQTLRLFAIGGSTTESFYIDDRETWPALLEAKLNEYYSQKGRWNRVEIINAGRSGEISNHHLEKAENFLRFSPDGYIFLMGANDLLVTLRNLDGSGKEVVVRKVKVRKVSDPLDRLYDAMASFWESTKLHRLFFDSYNIAFNPEKYRRLDNVGAEVQALRDETQRAKLVDLPPEYLVPNKNFQNNVSEISRICRDNKIICVILTQPSIYYDGMPPELEKLLGLRPKEPDYKFSVADMAKVFEAYNNFLRRSADSRWIYVMDLAKILPKDTSVFYDDVHFNNGGSAKVAEAVASFVTSRDLFSNSKP